MVSRIFILERVQAGQEGAEEKKENPKQAPRSV